VFFHFRSGRLLWIVSVLVSSLVLNVFFQYYTNVGQTLHLPFRPSGNESQIQNETFAKKEKIILFWTTWYIKNYWPGFKDGFDNGQINKCPISNCLLTNNRSLFNESHAVIFHMQPGDFYVGDLPKHRYPHQRFVMYFFEPIMFSRRKIFDSVPAHYFNWTFTFRRFSDVASTQYGAYEFIPESMERKVIGDASNEESLNDYYGVNITNKSIMVAWFVSHCSTDVGRERYAAELAKYVRVDIFGRCGNFSCNRTQLESEECDRTLAQNYLFYLSFENSFCPDYVTEKLFRPLRTSVVPIVFGGVHYSRFAPPHSYINALDYESPKQLADYLITLEKNRKLYAHYFEWRHHFHVPKVSYVDWCQLCAMLNDESLPAKSYENISQWWFDDYPCQDYKWEMKL
jgi:alpha-1,3-fucosyltransferase